jgi:uridine kinase
MQNPYLIGITGGRARHKKTTFLRRLASSRDQICLISQDNHYHPRESAALTTANFDLPASIDVPPPTPTTLCISQGHEVRRKEVHLQ